MSVRVWLHAIDRKRLAEYSDTALEQYAGEGKEELVTGTLDGGVLTHISNDFVLEKFAIM